ncbi:MAG TPA: DUF120 domain-containing protein [Candidatus Eisenbacteria bacterium]|nr:DUF120 domain-containing protein [Candidatus Eisenbacteria bacterium]
MTGKTLILKGTVQAGKSEGSEFLKLAWVTEQIKNKLAFAPFPGTLNLRLDENDASKLKKTLIQVEPIEIIPEDHFCPGRCYKASINDESMCAILIPEVSGYPSNLVEIVSPDNLRKKLKLADGDKVKIKLCV